MIWLDAAVTAVRDQYRHGLGLFVAAPLAVALVAIPELAQHVVEIRLGMFDSRAAARALASDPTRWAFGYAKLTGLALAFMACARAVWGQWEGGRWYDLRGVAWGRMVVGLALFVVVGSMGTLFHGRLGRGAELAIDTFFSIVSAPFVFLALAGLFGDRAPSWRPLLTRSWPAAALLVLLFVTAVGPGQAVHYLDHRLALGRPAIVVWALMIWDALVVGAIAALTGAAFALSYRRARASAGGRSGPVF